MMRVLAVSVILFVGLSLAGCSCSSKKKSTQMADFTAQPVMACPKCSAPTRPFRLNESEAYYRCSGQPPKYADHYEFVWTAKAVQPGHGCACRAADNCK